MVNKKKLAFFSLLFFIAFTIIGDAYIYYLDGKVFESDFKYTTDVKSEKLNREYIQDLDRLSKELNLKIYVVSSTVNSSNLLPIRSILQRNIKIILKKNISKE